MFMSNNYIQFKDHQLPFVQHTILYPVKYSVIEETSLSLKNVFKKLLAPSFLRKTSLERDYTTLNFHQSFRNFCTFSFKVLQFYFRLNFAVLSYSHLHQRFTLHISAVSAANQDLFEITLLSHRLSHLWLVGFYTSLRLSIMSTPSQKYLF